LGVVAQPLVTANLLALCFLISAFVCDLSPPSPVHREEQERAELRQQFAELDAADGSNDTEPPSVLDIVREVKKERRAA
jgi:hypothetical protein